MKKTEIILFCLTLFSAIGYTHIIFYEYTNFEIKNIDKIEEIPIFIFANDELVCVKQFDKIMNSREMLIKFDHRFNLMSSSLSIQNHIEKMEQKFYNELFENKLNCGNYDYWCRYSEHYKTSCLDVKEAMFNQLFEWSK